MSNQKTEENMPAVKAVRHQILPASSTDNENIALASCIESVESQGYVFVYAIPAAFGECMLIFKKNNQ